MITNDQSSDLDYHSLLAFSSISEDLKERASTVIKILHHNNEFRELYLCDSPGHYDAYVMSHSNRCLLFDLLTRCPSDQVTHIGSYTFRTHRFFEEKVSRYCRTEQRPNMQLSSCRTWDVAFNVMVKVEMVDPKTNDSAHSFLLKREYKILHYLWETNLKDELNFDEMTGIPMVFDFKHIRNSHFMMHLSENPYQFDIYGTLVPIELKRGRAKCCLSYLTTEKLGPSLEYLNDLMRSPAVGRSFSSASALLVFDQLLCRCLQIHRLGVVHRSVEPHHIHFGRGVCLNVVYLSNFSLAAVIDERDPFSMGKGGFDRCLVGNPRFASRSILPGAGSHPYYDIESSFYTLLYMLLNRLPWDSKLRLKEAKFAKYKPSVVDRYASLLPQLQKAKNQFWFNSDDFNHLIGELRLANTENPLVIEIVPFHPQVKCVMR